MAKKLIFLGILLLAAAYNAAAQEIDDVTVDIHGDNDYVTLKALINIDKMRGSSIPSMSIICYRLGDMTHGSVSSRQRNINLDKDKEFKNTYLFDGTDYINTYVYCNVGNLGKSFRRKIGVISLN